MRKKLTFTIFFIVLFNLFMTISASASEVAVKVNGELINFPDQKPFINNTVNHTYTPVRFISEALGFNVKWDEQSQNVNIIKEEKNICISVASNEQEVNGKEKQLNISAKLVNNRVMVPLRFISDNMDVTIDWDKNSNTVLLSSSEGTGFGNLSKVDYNVTQIFAFGDSYTDDGRSQKISREIMDDPEKPSEAFILPSDPQYNLYWQGRWSNGPTAVEILANNLDVKLTNYAVGGAKGGYENYYTWIDKYQKTGVLGQIEQFKSSLQGKKADPNALYFIFISANDYFHFMDYSLPGTIKETADQSVTNISIAVSKLADLGAQKFFIVNSTDLSVVPWEVISNRTESAAAFTSRVNEKLPETINNLEEELNISILLFDHTLISQEIRDNPEMYGLTELNKPCERTYPEIKIAAPNQDEYYFWDEWHPTRVVHEIVGKEMTKALSKQGF